MALSTDISLRKRAIYQVFVRQHTKEGTFRALVGDLDRIKHMGFDTIYILPIHPIGLKARKGEKGSPYAIYDFYAINEDYGSLDDLIYLKQEINKRGMFLMLDMVFNHTSRDSVLTLEHPDWFYHKEDGDFANRIGDWSDITDLRFELPEVRQYFTNVLAYWAKYTDGFRCDVAPLLPLDFWTTAIASAKIVNPELFLLTESVELHFIKYLRDKGYGAQSDSMMYQVFDACYDYDVFGYFLDVFKDEKKLARWIEEIGKQEMIYPANYIKVRAYENHDQDRLRSRVKTDSAFKQYLALLFFLRGIPFIYAGMEHQVTHHTDLFEVDLIPWNKAKSVEGLITKLNEISKSNLVISGVFDTLASSDFVALSYSNEKERLIGIFNVLEKDSLSISNLDGTYTNLLNDEVITIKQELISDVTFPIIIHQKLK